MTITAGLRERRSLSQGEGGVKEDLRPGRQPLPLKLPPYCISIQVSNST